MRLATLLLTTLLCQSAPLQLQEASLQAPARGRCSHHRARRGVLLAAAAPPTPASRPARPAPDSPMLNYIFDSHAPAHKHLHDRYNSPMFEDVGGSKGSQVTSVEADTGETAHLDCKVTGLTQEKLVSWLRVYENDQLELLTIGLKTHTADNRYRVEVVGGDNWRLAVVEARTTESGLYCCQISTHPPMIRRAALTVHAPELRLPRDAFLESGETLSLRCFVRHVRLPPGAALHWFRGSVRVDLDPLAGGVLVSTEHRERNVTSELQVARLTPSDAGNYTCRLDLPSTVSAAPTSLQSSATVHVLQGSSLAELQSEGCTSCLDHILLVLTLILHSIHSIQTARGVVGR